MDELTAFITARLDEDEAAAHAGARRVGMPWRVEPQPGTPGGLVLDEIGLVGSTGGRYAADHIARHGPARVLREVAAKRFILGAHVSAATVDRLPITESYLDGYVSATEVVLRALAAVWSDHPDYRAEWA